MLQAYLEEFKPEEDVTLHLQTYIFQGGKQAHNPAAVWRKIDRFASLMGFDTEDIAYRDKDIPSIHVMAKEIDTVDLPSLYAACDAFVLPTHGEGKATDLNSA